MSKLLFVVLFMLILGIESSKDSYRKNRLSNWLRHKKCSDKYSCLDGSFDESDRLCVLQENTFFNSTQECVKYNICMGSDVRICNSGACNMPSCSRN